MNRSPAISPGIIRKAAHWLLLCALLLQAWIPAGFMPDFSRLAEGGYPLALCAGSLIQMDGAQAGGHPPAAASDHDQAHGAHSGHHEAGDAAAGMAPVGPCPFATMAGAALPILLYALFFLVVWPRRLETRPPRAHLPRPVYRSEDCLARGPPGFLLPVV